MGYPGVYPRQEDIPRSMKEGVDDEIQVIDLQEILECAPINSGIS
jgi:hypothetical protein